MIKSNLNISEIKSWLTDNSEKVKLDISNSKCNKWENWLEDKSTHIYPCVCSNREQDCIFIETYYQLDRVIQLHQKEEYFNILVQEYKQIASDNVATFEWLKTHKKLASEIAFDTEISIMLELEPYKTSKIILNENEFKNIIEFQNIFNELEYNQIINS
ncbi:hypothetical protein [Flavobacterium oreochromis]|uniref:DUF4268 domain-containing protein n=1 Tax=Flavobacterium oreochromis TaxID=2906078 RepID=A0ABW8P8S0_9FLAO|nr:hypothetical protein [Flavobacterium oreochromis]OWP78512.1 hypothetical protein BWG23_01740 [Flavobacterium oreochromis]POR30456.1 hypothetical protein BWK58_01670 [Flavobacterium columnare]